VKFGGRQSDKSSVAYFKKNKISPGSPSRSRYCADRAQNLPGSAPDFTQIGSLFGGVIPERVNTIKTHPKVFPIFG